jgi:hypothetical protein
MSYVMDSYYSWGKILARKREPLDYKLRKDSKEWEILMGYIPQNREWLEYIGEKFHVRYEDYYVDFEATTQSIGKFLGQPSLNGFEKPRKNASRMYWSNEYHRLLDEEVFLTLRDEFYSQIARYWPEKLESLRQ